MTESLIPVSPGFDTPLEMIEACHERLQAQLVTLEKLARWLPEHGADEQARSAARNVMRYFDIAAVNHHRDEEDDLLPALLARVSDEERAELTALVDTILADHQRLFATWADMRQLLAYIAAGEMVDISPAQVAAFSERYQRHIECEEQQLLPIARRLLEPEALSSLGVTMTRRRQTTSAEEGG